MEDNLPVYNIVIDKETQGLNFVSFVADPAIMEMGLAFSKNEQASFKFNKDKQVVVGPAMIADLPLYREIDGEGFYVVFTKEVIEELVEKFNKDSIDKKINVDHGDVVESAFIKSNWIKEDMKFDKSNIYGFENIPVGSWFIEVKVDDAAFWENDIKSGGKFGFSVEGIFGLNYQEFNKKNNENKMDIKNLTPEEITLIEKFRNGTFAEEVVEVEEEEVVEAASEDEIIEEEEDSIKKEEEVINEEKDEEEVEAEEAPVEEAPVEEAQSDEDAIMALVQPKLDELVAMIAEVKSMVEANEVPTEDVPVLLSVDTRAEKLKLFRQKFVN